jgi:CMP-2-keto-3-deoxyoctulosonic acid synthetase
MAIVPQRTAAPTKAANKPVAKVGGRGVTASVWKQATKDGRDFYTVTVQRSYTDAEKQWKNTNSFRMQDIPVLTSALNDIYNKYVVKEL